MTNKEMQHVTVLLGTVAALSLSFVLNEKAKVFMMKRETERNIVLIKETHRILKNFHDDKYKDLSEIREDFKFSNIIFQTYLNDKFA